MKQVNKNFYRDEDIIQLSPIYENSDCFWFDVTIRLYRKGWFGLVPYLHHESVKSEVFTREEVMADNTRESVKKRFEITYRRLI